MNGLKLKPIKPDIPLPEHHYVFWISGLIILILLLILIYFLNKRIKIKKEKKALFSIINEPKKFAYEFTKKAKKYKNKKNEKILEQILKELENYKYRPKVNNIDENTINLIKRYLELQ